MPDSILAIDEAKDFYNRRPLNLAINSLLWLLVYDKDSRLKAIIYPGI